jgi:hypothetical protein
MTTLTTTTPTTRRPLLHRYPQQSSPQPAYLRLTDDGSVDVDWDSEIGGGVPADVWDRRTFRWYFGDPSLTRDEIDILLALVAPLIARVHEGHSIEWDGSNYVGYLSDDAVEAEETLERLCIHAYSVEEWDEDLDGELADYYNY